MINVKTIEIQMKLKELYNLKKKRSGSLASKKTNQTGEVSPNQLRTDTLITESSEEKLDGTIRQNSIKLKLEQTDKLIEEELLVDNQKINTINK